MSGKGNKRVGKRPSMHMYTDPEIVPEKTEKVYPLLASTQRITKPSIRRLAKRGGVQRINGEVYDQAREFMERYVRGVVKVSLTYTELANRKTITVRDTRDALKRVGRPLYSSH